MAYKNGSVVRMDPSEENTTAYTYSQQATIISDEAYHGGGDVAIYAIGITRRWFINYIQKK